MIIHDTQAPPKHQYPNLPPLIQQPRLSTRHPCLCNPKPVGGQLILPKQFQISFQKTRLKRWMDNIEGNRVGSFSTALGGLFTYSCRKNSPRSSTVARRTVSRWSYQGLVVSGEDWDSGWTTVVPIFPEVLFYIVIIETGVFAVFVAGFKMTTIATSCTKALGLIKDAKKQATRPAKRATFFPQITILFWNDTFTGPGATFWKQQHHPYHSPTKYHKILYARMSRSSSWKNRMADSCSSKPQISNSNIMPATSTF